MVMINFDDETFRAMSEVQAEVVKALMPFRARTESALVVFALIRCARVMMRLYPEKFQKELLAAVVPYLEGKDQPRQTGDHSLLWTPPGSMN